MRYIFVVCVTLAFWPLGWLPDWFFACSLLAFAFISRELSPPERRPGYITFSSGRDHRDGGSPPRVPSVSVSANPGTVARVGMYTACLPDGLRPAAPEELRTRLARNRTTARGVSTFGHSATTETDTPPGTHTMAAKARDAFMEGYIDGYFGKPPVYPDRVT